MTYSISRLAHSSNRFGREEGQALIMVALLMTSVLGFLGFVLDYGQSSLRHRQTQNAADAAAQGAAAEIYLGAQSEQTATAMARQLMALHGYNAANLTTLQYLDSTMTPTANAASVMYVHAVVAETFRTLLLSMIGLPTATVNAQATVKMVPGTAPCALCLISATQGLTISGSQTINVTNGAIWIDDALAGAITASGTPAISATQIGVVASGASAVAASGSPSFTPAPTTGAPPVPDPLRNVPAPSVTTAGSVASGPCTMLSGVLTVAGTATCTINPGIYSGTNLSGSGTIQFYPGIYVFTGSMSKSGTWDFKNLTSGGDGSGGVMLYLTCSSYSSTNRQPCNQSAGAGIDWSGLTTYQLTAPASGPYQGLAIFYDRTNTAGITLSGNSSDNFTGTIYAADSAGTTSGTFVGTQFDSMIILNTLIMSGTTNINLIFDKTKNYSLAQLPVYTQ